MGNQWLYPYGYGSHIALYIDLARAKGEAPFNINLLKQNIKSDIAKEAGEDNEKGKINNN